MGFDEDLMIVDILEGLFVPQLSIFATTIPAWNKLRHRFLDTIFASSHVYDTGAILVFHTDDLNIKTKLSGFMKAYGFFVIGEWMGSTDYK
jgi:hypothetical protein